MATSSRTRKTKFSLYIVESLSFRDEKENRLEGKILRDIFRLSGHEVRYLYIRTRQELRAALKRFFRSRRRYLHISCHGNANSVELTLDSVPFADFAREVTPYLKKHRLFISACAVVNRDLAKRVIRSSGCYSVIGPKEDIHFDDAVLMWASFYHLMFRDREIDFMKSGKIRWALRRIRHTFEVEFEYFRKSKDSVGFSRVNIDKK